jgi:hypothetical protein
MALIPCPECATEVSERAPTCPRCGAPIAGAAQPNTPATAAGTGKPASDEVNYYSDQLGVRITNARAIMQNKTYSMANLSSVSMWVDMPKRLWPALLIILGFLQTVSCAAGRDTKGMALLGILALGWGIAWIATLKPTYWVRLTAAGGEANALRSKQKDYIQTVINALNEAIVKRG